MDIIVYKDDTDEVVIAERDRIWGEFKKYRKGKFPHILYIILSVIVSVIVFIYLDLFAAILTAILLFFILVIIIEIFGQKFFKIEEFKDEFNISDGDIIISYGTISEFLGCYIVLTDKTNFLILTENDFDNPGIYISDRNFIFDSRLYVYNSIYQDINTDILESINWALPSDKKSSNFYNFGDLRSYILLGLTKVYKEHVKDM